MTQIDPQDEAAGSAGANKPGEAGVEPARSPVTPLRLVLWSLPFLASLLVLAATFALNWEPWFGYASVIAGALGSLMVAGEALGAKGG
ncbi:hypothetical protein ACWCOP_09095 [Maricaulaceae bacterium MS644]